MSETGLPEYMVIEARWVVHPFLDGDDGPLPLNKPMTDILVKIDGEWIPPGCETWDVTDTQVLERSTFVVLALPSSWPDIGKEAEEQDEKVHMLGPLGGHGPLGTTQHSPALCGEAYKTYTPMPATALRPDGSFYVTCPACREAAQQ